MSIENDLKREGIEIIKSLDTLKVNLIASKVANTIIDCLPNLSLDYKTLFIKLSRCNMYIAKLPQGTAKAKYFYKNSSIYFHEDTDFNYLNNFIIHECIHRVQEYRDSKNNLLRLGLCDFLNARLPGMGLNEAAVQLLTTKCLNNNRENVKYYGISLNTTSPEYYPLECALVNQMAYVVGEDNLYKSTLFATTDFKDEFIKVTSKKTYITIENNIDQIIFAEDELASLYTKLESIDQVDSYFVKATNKIEKLKNKITNKFTETQNLILTSYFDAAFNKLSNPIEIERYRNQLYNFKNYIGSVDNDNFYTNYYVEKMSRLEQKYIELENPNTTQTALVPAKTGIIVSLFRKISNLIGKATEA